MPKLVCAFQRCAGPWLVTGGQQSPPQTHCCFIPLASVFTSSGGASGVDNRGTGMRIAGLPRGWNRIVRDSRGSVAVFDSCGFTCSKIFVLKLLNNVFSDFTKTNCIIIS